MRKLKFQLDRRSLEVIYLTFIRPILKYADVVYLNCTQYEKLELDKIEMKHRATKLVSLVQLHSEVP
jgi:hypothetical protein